MTTFLNKSIAKFDFFLIFMTYHYDLWRITFNIYDSAFNIKFEK